MNPVPDHMTTLPSSSVEDRNQPSAGAQADVLFVDLDGTLIATDLLLESMLLAVKRDPANLLRLPLWLLNGKASLKQALAKVVSPDVASLPYRQDALQFLSQERAAGRKLVLATASPASWARQVADELGIFDDVLATDDTHNLKGPAKLAAMEAWCNQQGYERFAYMGDAAADLPIWRQAAQVYAVAPGRGLLEAVRQLCEPVRVFPKENAGWKAAVRALRPKQWVKNLLIFLPLILSHQLTNPAKLLAAVWAFVAFSACASMVYVLNDLLDVEADRRHPVKRQRPFASGDLPVAWGPPLALALLLLAGTITLNFLPWSFAGALLLYLVTTTFYSAWLKSVVLVDVFLLAGLYTLRIFAGGFATEVEVSEWLLAFSVFLFTSLAFVKRYAELARIDDEGGAQVRGRGYRVSDISMIESVGPTSGYMAVLVMALYINSNAVQPLYKHPVALWMICPLLLYWITRLWLFARRRSLSEDPVIFAIKDRVSLLVAALAGLLMLVATGW